MLTFLNLMLFCAIGNITGYLFCCFRATKWTEDAVDATIHNWKVKCIQQGVAHWTVDETGHVRFVWGRPK